MSKHEGLLEALRKDLSSLDSELDVYRGNVLLSTLFKKYVPELSDAKKLESEALDDFLSRNAEMAASPFVVSLELVPLLDRVRRRLETIFFSGPDQTSVLTLNHCVNLGLPGPGSSRGVRETDFVGKMFQSDLTTTNLNLYVHYVDSLSDQWLLAELVRTASYGTKVLCGSNITTVPKDAKKNRTIATEPSLNMFYQKGAQKVLEDLLRRYFRIDVSRQPDLNVILACASSIDGSLATIDLKNASDSWHVDLVKYLLPPAVFEVLDTIRSRSAVIRGEEHVLSMFSTMGNGFTFPLMTLLFAVILDEFLQEYGDAYTPYRDGIFGDDIILPSCYATSFINLLEKLGFIVNTDKSFTTGFFRESCGGDFYHGYDVRGVYVRKFTTNEDYYSTFNRLLAWGVRNNILLCNALGYLKGLAKFQPVPLDEPDTSGFKIPSCFLSSPKYDVNGSIYYRYSKPVKRVRRVNDRSYNHQGAFIGFLGGYVRDNMINLRNDETEGVIYKVAKNVTPSWDFIPNARVSLGGLIKQWASLLSAPTEV